jgi:phosphate transport system permease protein
VRDGLRGSAHSRRIAGQKVAFGVIRAFSMLTIVILGLIMAFILYRGLRFSNETRSTVLPFAEAEPDSLVFVVNRETMMRSIEFPMLYGIFTDEYINWAKLTADDFDLLPVIIDPKNPDGAAVAAFLFGGSSSQKMTASQTMTEAAQWGGLVKKAPDAQAALDLVDSNPGAAGIVPAAAFKIRKAAGKAEHLVTVPVRRLELAINDDVAALIDNRSIEDLNDATVTRLMDSQVPDWKSLGGPDLAVRLLAPPPGSSLEAVVKASGHPASGAQAIGGMDGYIRTIQATSGAAGFLFGAEVQAQSLQTLTIKGVESGWNLNFQYLVEAPRLSGKVGGISTIIANTFFMLLLTILFAAPIGVAAAVYLVEYAKQGPLVRLLRLGTETLAGIPSIIFGLFGYLFFVTILHFGFGLLSGCLTLTLMILPTIVRTSEEALKSVSGSLREGSLALGATKLQTIVRVVVPAASSGILTGLILGVGRAVGETAALLFTLGSDYKLAKGLFSSARVLSSHVYLLFAEGISFDRAFSTATVLIVIILVFNFGARRLVGRMGGK